MTKITEAHIKGAYQNVCYSCECLMLDADKMCFLCSQCVKKNAKQIKLFKILAIIQATFLTVFILGVLYIILKQEGVL